MPIIYRQRSSSFSDSESEPETENTPPVPTDADDSIVLSDLVRTGEASRLRRRGAMRLDHGHTAQTNPPRGFSPAVIVVGSPTWESEPEDPQGGPAFSRERNPRYARSQPRSRRIVDESGLADVTYTMFCGGDASDSEEGFDSHSHKPYEPSALPLYPHSSSSSLSSSRSRRQRKSKVSNGCGALLHMSATPRPRQNTWLAKGGASTAVVGLDACYFDRETATKIVRSACGCVREGIGCAVCGNPLGTRYKACKDAGDGEAGHRHKSTLPLRPEGPRYWRPHSHPHSHPPNAEPYIYTFYPTMVSSTPSFTFPARRTTTHSSSSTMSMSQSALMAQAQADRGPDYYESDDAVLGYTNTMFDRFMTASPTQLSDVGEDEREPSSQGGFLGVDVPSYMQGPGGGLNYGEFDPDGEYILDAEPSSPDKTNEIMLFPER